MANPEVIKRAFFKVKGAADKVEVHFNPETLQYTITNNLQNQGKGNKKKQFVSDSTGKLSMDLIFDTTGSGEDVRLKTNKVARFMEPSQDKTPPVLDFEWGLYKFSGMLEAYKESIDFFSADGVPLRAAVSLTLSSQDQVFEGGSAASKAATGGSAGLPNDAVAASSTNNKGVTGVATQAGNPGAAKALAAQNGLESMRFTAGASLQVGGEVSLKSAAAFSAGALNVSAGSDLFSGLHAAVDSGASAQLNVDSLLSVDMGAGVGIDGGAAIGAGGTLGLQGAASFTAEVGKAGELKAKIEFDGG